MAHLPTAQQARGFAAVEFEVDERVLPIFRADDLPAGWDREPPGPASQLFGHERYHVHGCLGFRIPSIVVPTELDLVLFPGHERFQEVRVIQAAVPFPFDSRLFAKE